jgi:hypothetical protein
MSCCVGLVQGHVVKWWIISTSSPPTCHFCLSHCLVEWSRSSQAYGRPDEYSPLLYSKLVWCIKSIPFTPPQTPLQHWYWSDRPNQGRTSSLPFPMPIQFGILSLWACYIHGRLLPISNHYCLSTDTFALQPRHLPIRRYNCPSVNTIAHQPIQFLNSQYYCLKTDTPSTI